jgi:cytochrome P450
MGHRVETKTAASERLKNLRVPPNLDASQWQQFNWMRKDFLGYLEKGRGSGGDIVCLNPLPFQRIYLITSAELAQEITGPLGHLFKKSDQTRMMVGKFLGEGLVLSENKRHRSDRKFIGKLLITHFSEERVAKLCETVLVRNFEKKLSQINVKDIEGLWERVSFEVIGRGLFGENGFHSSGMLFNAMQRFAAAIGGRFRTIPLPEWLPTVRNRSEKEAIVGVHAALGAAHESCDEMSLAGELKKYYHSLPDGRLLWTNQIKTLLFAGHETVAKVLSWATYYLCSNPHIQQQLRAEQLHLDCFIHEVLRIRPPVWVFDRSPVEDVQVGAFILREGCKVYISPYFHHHEPEYFSDPEEFNPNRFKDDKKSRAYMPFGLGVRSCVGRQFALTETKVVLQWLLNRFQIHSNDNLQEVGMKTGATLGMNRPFTATFQRLKN